MTNSLATWQAARLAELRAPDSWLGLIGLYWLEPGRNRVGSGEDCLVRLPAGPVYLGDLDWRDGRITWQVLGGEPCELSTDHAGQPSLVRHENYVFFIVDRESRLAVRVRDLAWAEKQPFAGMEYFPEAANWRVVARWQPLSPPLSMEVPNVSGELKKVEVSHKAVFEHGGQVVELLPMSVGEHEVFFVFRDRTSGKQSYGAGRFLKANFTVDGQICLDFNRAYNPPCAFTPFATCPLPPPENWLPFAVEAGELKPIKLT